MSRTTTIKAGATLQYDATVSNSGVPVNLTGWTITSQVKTPSGVLVGTVLATVLDQSTNLGKYRLRAQTAGWRLGVHGWDIAYSYSDGSGGQSISYTESIELEVVAAVTSLV